MTNASFAIDQYERGKVELYSGHTCKFVTVLFSKIDKRCDVDQFSAMITTPSNRSSSNKPPNPPCQPNGNLLLLCVYVCFSPKQASLTFVVCWQFVYQTCFVDRLRVAFCASTQPPSHSASATCDLSSTASSSSGPIDATPTKWRLPSNTGTILGRDLRAHDMQPSKDRWMTSFRLIQPTSKFIVVVGVTNHVFFAQVRGNCVVLRCARESWLLEPKWVTFFSAFLSRWKQTPGWSFLLKRVTVRYLSTSPR